MQFSAKKELTVYLLYSVILKKSIQETFFGEFYGFCVIAAFRAVCEIVKMFITFMKEEFCMNNVTDLRSAIELLKSIPGEYVETDVEVDPKAELSGVYRHVGAGGTVMRPTKIGPAMMFNSIKGHPGAKVIIGVLASRKRVAALLDVEPDRLGFYMRDAVKKPIPPVDFTGEKPPCQEVVHYDGRRV